MAHAQKLDLVFQRNGRVHLNRQGRQFSRLLAAEVCASAVVMVVMLDTPCSEVECKTTGNPLHSHVFPYRASPCAIRFHLSYTYCSPPSRTPWSFQTKAGRTMETSRTNNSTTVTSQKTRILNNNRVRISNLALLISFSLEILKHQSWLETRFT